MTLHGACLSFPIRPDQRGTLATVSDRTQIIAESIESILETRQGERLMLPDYGIPDFVFSVMDAGFAGRLAFFIKQQIERYEPLVDRVAVRMGVLKDKKFLPDIRSGNSQEVAVKIEFTERGSNVPRNLVFPIWRLRR